MEESNSQHPDLDRYLDGLLEGDALTQFEARVREDANLRAEVERAHEVDQSLRVAFAPPGVDVVERMLASVRDANAMGNDKRTASGGVVGSVSARPWLGIAASIAIAFVAGWLIFQNVVSDTPADPYGPQDYRPMAQVWDDTVDAGFKPLWKCESDRQFATEFWRRLGEAATLENDLPTGTMMSGLSFANTISEGTMVMLGYHDDEPIMLFMDLLENDRNVERIDSASTGLNTFRREALPFVIYEVSRLDEAHLMQHVNPIEMPDEWIPGRNRPNLPPPNDGG